tara:strand:- start:190 stop:732 length:543 start_codon:yes stop_codon:yes gene_type:complete
MAQGLLLIDIQNDYFAGGAMELVAMERAADKAASVLKRCRSKGCAVFHVQHLAARPEAGFFIPDTPGAEINTRVQPAAGESVTQKHFPNAFRDTDLEQALRSSGIDELVIVGAMSHMCIDATTRAAFDLGFTCAVLEDACATRDLTFNDKPVSASDVHASFMAALGGIYATVTTADSVCS